MNAARIAPVLLLLANVASADDRWPTLKSTSQKVLWAAPPSATQPEAPPPGRCDNPVFSPDGQTVAFLFAGPTGSQVLAAGVADGKTRTIFEGDSGAELVQLAFSTDGLTIVAAARTKSRKGEPRLLVDTAGRGPASLGLPAYEFAMAPGGGLIALVNKDGISSLRPDKGLSDLNALLPGKGTQEEPAPYHDLAFSPKGDFLVAVGTIKPPFTVQGQGPGHVVFLGDTGEAKNVELPVCTPDIAISPDGKQIAAAVWTHSPVGVERPGGLMVWNVDDLRAGRLDGKFVMDPAKFICGNHVYAGGIFWLDGKLSCLATELQPEPGRPFRRFGVWQADSQPGEGQPAAPQPKRISIVGPMPKRMFPDPAGHGVIMWRYHADAGMFLLDERTGRVVRFDDSLKANNGTLTVSPDFKRLAIARGSQIVVHQLEEVK